MDFYSVATLPTSARQADFSFEIADVVVVPFEDRPLRTISVQSRWKSYEIDDDLFEHNASVDGTRFIAEESGQLAGYIAISHDWNGSVLVNDLAVVRSFRRRGVATALMDEAVGWALNSKRRTIRLETQSNNVAACRFYLRYGFVLGGYDRFLYRDLGPDISEEVALFWYLNVGSPEQLSD